MLEAQFHHPIALRCLNAVGSGLRSLRLPVAKLKEESLCRSAMNQTGLKDFGDPYYRQGLCCLLDSAVHDARLNFFGEMFLSGMVQLYLADRLLLIERMKRQSEIFQQPLVPPIIINGIPRSGTTFLHRLLSVDPAHRSVPLWELSRPIPPMNGRHDHRQQSGQLQFDIRSFFAADFDKKHFTRPEEPDECIFMLGLTFTSMVFWDFSPLYGYMEWYREQNNFRKKYQDYRRLLQVLQSTDPTKRLVLKAPEHTSHIDVLLEMVPEAMIIQTHRDPVTTVPSLNSLFYSLLAPMTDQIDLKKMAGTALRNWSWVMEKNLAARRNLEGRILDIAYEQIVADPVGTVREVYKHFNLDWPPGLDALLQEYVEQNSKDKHGRHRYQPEDYGQTAEEIAGHFEGYRQEFGFTRKPDRIDH